MTQVRFITIDPGHFHAALVQKETLEGVSPRVDVYAPLGPELSAHLNRILGFNTRREDPTAWQLEVHAGADFLERMFEERSGNVVILAGRNRDKIERIKACVEAGLHVLADKPWIIHPADLPKLESALNTAEQKGLIAYDIMTERFEITSILQRELVNDPETFGNAMPGTADEPGVYVESVHYLMKQVAGVPLRRPASFFDVQQQGEGLTDVGTHLVDLVPWMLFPDQALDHRKDIQVLAAKRWPTVLSKEDFQRVTGETDFPAALASCVKNDRLDYFCNTQVCYTVRGIHIKFDVLWNYEAAEGGDTHHAVFRGSKSRVEIRQGKEQNYRPELYVVPNSGGEKPAIRAALQSKIDALQARFPGVGVADAGKELHLSIPDHYRAGHEAHFAQVTRQFLHYLERPRTLPTWEKPNMLAKYYVTTKGWELSTAGGSTSRR